MAEEENYDLSTEEGREKFAAWVKTPEAEEIRKKAREGAEKINKAIKSTTHFSPERLKSLRNDVYGKSKTALTSGFLFLLKYFQ